MTARMPTEAQEQAELVRWYDATYRCERTRHRLFMIPNGTHLAGGPRQRAAQASRLKAQGQRNGAPDLMLPIAIGGHHGLFIEMKRRKCGRVSPAQDRRLQMHRDDGYRAEVCNGADEAKQVIAEYLKSIPIKQ